MRQWGHHSQGSPTALAHLYPAMLAMELRESKVWALLRVRGMQSMPASSRTAAAQAFAAVSDTSLMPLRSPSHVQLRQLECAAPVNCRHAVPHAAKATQVSCTRRQSSKQQAWLLTNHGGLLRLQFVQQLLVACRVDVTDQPAAADTGSRDGIAGVAFCCCQLLLSTWRPNIQHPCRVPKQDLLAHLPGLYMCAYTTHTLP